MWGGKSKEKEARREEVSGNLRITQGREEHNDEQKRPAFLPHARFDPKGIAMLSVF